MTLAREKHIAGFDLFGCESKSLSQTGWESSESTKTPCQVRYNE